MKTYTIIDLETTGLSAQNDRITEVGAMKIREDGNVVGWLHTMVKLPRGQKVPKFITELTGITDEVLAGGLIQSKAMKALKEFAHGSILVAQNAPFDLEFIKEKGGGIPRQYVCTRALSKLVFPEERQHNLKAICARLGIELNGHHRAMNDVQATALAFRIMAAMADERGIEYMNTVIDFPDRPLKYKPNWNTKVVKI